MPFALGVDTLSYHCRLEAGELSIADLMREAAELDFDFVQLNAYHLRNLTDAEIHDVTSLAKELGLGLTLAADIVGTPADKDPAVGADRVVRWTELAKRLGSPYVRCSSGFYRNEMLGDPEGIEAHKRYLIEALSQAVSRLGDGAVKVLLENHSDFTPDEYSEIIDGVGSDNLGVFLDVINPITMLLDPLPVVKRLAPLASAGHVKDFRLVSRYVEDGFHRRGFDVQYCYPGEGAANLRDLLGAIEVAAGETYHLSIEGLDNYKGIADQRDRLAASAAVLRPLLAGAGDAAGDGVRR